MIFQKISLIKRITQFGKRGKLNPRYFGPYEILEKVGNLAYKLALTLELSGIHLVFYISMLERNVQDPNHILKNTSIQIKECMEYEVPIRILDHHIKKL